MVDAWMKTKKISHLGIPLYVGSGSFEHESSKYRFMVISRFGTDVEKLYTENGSIFPEMTVYSLGLRIVDVLEYLHDSDYVHADIKASNLMLGYKKGETSKVYLLDYGLAYKYKPGGTHVAYKEDPKRKHDGTIEYTSRDAHKGLAPTRRADMEILGYCMIQWLCQKLPWEDKLQDKDYVAKQKEKYMGNMKEFMSKCFTGENSPDTMREYMEIINKIGYDEKPDYDKIRKLFKAGLKKCGVSDDGKTVCLPSAKTACKLPQDVSSPKKSRTALKDLAPENSPIKKSRTPAKRDVSPAKKATPVKRAQGTAARNSPRKPPAKEPQVSPIKKVQTSQGLRRSPRRSVVITSDESSDDDTGSLAAIKKAKTNAENGSNNIGKETFPDRVVLIDGVERTVHRRIRKRNVSTRDFAQSP